ncbi:uncharacterized protein BJ171DRAFT_607364 [Polychytrium aggregatum]|uniref:uncharacterized protein n=1 Tax=Polychytrium aggregatum TaxID=110093 RepID=UPI0022FE0FAA|nr:uncharacterized protein BJ171DRAFT_607364 [Polychytrium aggregatum]KAI9190521.1 hypothetical protein BJ171DRAFT_607364 [Polychytrium aggregatum]
MSIISEIDTAVTNLRELERRSLSPALRELVRESLGLWTRLKSVHTNGQLWGILATQSIDIVLALVPANTDTPESAKQVQRLKEIHTEVNQFIGKHILHTHGTQNSNYIVARIESFSKRLDLCWASVALHLGITAPIRLNRLALERLVNEATILRGTPRIPGENLNSKQEAIPVVEESGQNRPGSHALKYAGIAAAVIIPAVAVPLVAPAAIAAFGFGAGGVVAGSLAAGTQSMIGNVAAGSIFSLLQSAGVIGFSAAANTGMAAAGAAAGATVYGAAKAATPSNDK